ncbi:monofunctional biosynthetic peptidoglycan transglycosylase [Microvirga sp. 17 mud 1-3]|uniref:monofunctional biosynthetic peptidoglycan transglycosylase n=1 Tax=Microvirga sp. 17 mud 1-3 TaxID=2082949 RepID=UPI000D6D2FF5|nr:monofunctional biosynthetic peptidoglycan transglycosylase [Microvirga sp. 17 mud 1-3]AWM85795.1 monofunctional biosynthetic peptidoglycan transglycosylase [Microvirga sp. 17 mud 1-3]
MFSLNSGAEGDRSEGNEGPSPPQEPVLRRKPWAASRWLRRLVGLGLGLILLWAAAVFWLGLLYWGVPPVSTLMLGRWLTLQPVERTYVSLDEISPQLPLAVLTSEDGRFCDHRGVDWDALRDVVEAADEDGPARGASTIPMQTAKNLFLWSGRSYLRKGLELPVALYLDLIWSKRKMMENYLNIAEWGDGVFGAEAAARKYFGKAAKNLTRREAALLATALPNPIARNPGSPKRRHQALAARLMKRMVVAAPFSDCLRE